MPPVQCDWLLYPLFPQFIEKTYNFREAKTTLHSPFINVKDEIIIVVVDKLLQDIVRFRP